MPKEITHCILAEGAAHTMAASKNLFKQQIGREIYFLFEENPQVFYFGSVSPDLFYYDIRLPWELWQKNWGVKWSDRIHGNEGENTMEPVFAMLDILKDKESQYLLNFGMPLAYDETRMLALFVLGYLSHISLDTLLHPIVYHFAGNYYAENILEKKQAEARHRVIETLLDLYNLGAVGQDVTRYHGIKKMSLPKKVRDLVLAFLTLALLKVYKKHADTEYGTTLDNLSSVYEHPLFKVSLRAYKKQIIFNKMFQNKRLARWGFSYNRRRADKLQNHTSLFYPARSYAEYLQTNPGKYFTLESLKTYRHPVTNKFVEINREKIRRKVFARTHAFYRTAWLYATDKITRTIACRTLKGYNLNNGLVCTATNAMQYFSTIQVNGNFEIVEEGV
ncbi:MAG: hypothetical protein LDLANPLL_02724 [Turneriella sp.]|nr:hypothetical protein [Turneriella sp.]